MRYDRYHFVKNVPNVLTGMRAVSAISLLFLEAFSPIFTVVYVISGITDMLDGFLARKLHAESIFGARFDSICDLLLVIVCIIKIIPEITIPLWIIIWILIIASVRIFNILYGYVHMHRIIMLHTYWNKATGLLLFTLPLLLSVIEVVYAATIVCIVATYASIQEGYMIVRKSRAKM